MASVRVLAIGGYTPGSANPDGHAHGITRMDLDVRSGALVDRGLMAELPAPAYQTVDAANRLLISALESTSGGIAVHRWDRTTAQPYVGSDGSPVAVVPGMGPCHALVMPGGGHIVATQYADGRVALFAVDRRHRTVTAVDSAVHAGSGPDPDRQAGPHPHSAVATPDGSTVVVADLGTDCLYGYNQATIARGILGEGTVVAQCPAGSGPRHMAFHANGHLFVTGELDNTVTVWRWQYSTREAILVDCVPAFDEARADSDVPRSDAGDFPAHVVVDPSGTRLYVSVRGSDAIATFEIDGPRLRRLGQTPTGGQWPRHFALVGGHLVVANERSDLVTALPIDATTGVPGKAVCSAPALTPSCVTAL